jgi:hypothetical protein
MARRSCRSDDRLALTAAGLTSGLPGVMEGAIVAGLGPAQRQILRIFNRQVSLARALGFAMAACFAPLVNAGRS